MIIRTQSAMSEVTKTHATGVVIYDDFENPIAVAYEMANRILTVATVGSPEFSERLKQAGIQKEAKVTELVTDGNRIRFIS